MSPAERTEKTLITNRKARHFFTVLETFEAGLVLSGTEVKSLRGGGGSFVDAYATVEWGEMWMTGLHIRPYEQGNRYNLNADRRRKLLLHKRQTTRWPAAWLQKQYARSAAALYHATRAGEGRIGFVQRQKGDRRRDDIRDRDLRRDAEREMKEPTAARAATARTTDRARKVSLT
jgi:SsrA-binding protein